MKIRYIENSGYAILENKYNILFDYYKGELPNFEKDKPLFVFVSHRHYDHFSKAIFDLSKKVDKIFYILSDDIPRKDLESELVIKTIFLKEREQKVLELGEIELKIYSYKSTDEGLAFVIDIENKRFYHAGDLNYWYWELETKEWNESIKKAYIEEIELIKQLLQDKKAINIAFLPLDNRQGDFAYLGIEYFLEKIDVKKIFPMHFNGDFDIISKLKERLSKENSSKIIDIKKENEEFIL